MGLFLGSQVGELSTRRHYGRIVSSTGLVIWSKADVTRGVCREKVEAVGSAESSTKRSSLAGQRWGRTHQRDPCRLGVGPAPQPVGRW